MMTREDKIKTAAYLRSICNRIMVCDWPQDEYAHVAERVLVFRKTADDLELEAFKQLSVAQGGEANLTLLDKPLCATGR
jgi:hypothetical protein